MQLRNKIMYHLVTQVQMGIISAPFNEPPNFNDLIQVKIPKTYSENFLDNMPQSMVQPMDQGAFLVSQPVPKCGAFCYLAVVSRKTNR